MHAALNWLEVSKNEEVRAQSQHFKDFSYSNQHRYVPQWRETKCHRLLSSGKSLWNIYEHIFVAMESKKPNRLNLPSLGGVTENFLELMIRSKSSCSSISIVVALDIFAPSTSTQQRELAFNISRSLLICYIGFNKI